MRTLHPIVPIVAIFCALASSTPAAPQKNSAAPQSVTKPGGSTPATSTAASGSRASEEQAATKLPVRRVILYKTGVGYFEHLGHVRGNEAVRIDFTSGQLNDVLQSLTVLDLNGGRISGVNYNSEAPLSERLGTLRLPLEEKTDLSKFYGALRGARLQIRSGTTTITGRLLSVERKTRVSGGTTLEVDLATVVSDSGEVRSVELTPAVSVQLAESDVTHEVGQYLHLLASVRQEDLRRMTVATEGTGDRQLYVSYISEVPIWKTTYRIVLPRKSGDEPLLQGWAIVDNTVGEDWNNVELSLVAGAPQSFIQPLSQPLYGRRPVVPLSFGAQLTPQTHEGAMLGGLAALSGRVFDPSGAVVPGAQVALLSESGEQVGSTVSDGQGSYSFGDLSAAVYRLKVEKEGFKVSMFYGLSLGGGHERTQDVSLELGSNTQVVTVVASTPQVNTYSMSMVMASGGNRAGSGGHLGSGRGIGSGHGAGVGPGSAGGTGGGYVATAPAAESVSAARSSMLSAAQGSDLGDLFEYKLKDRVTIHKNESSLVPIVQAHVQTEKVSLWNPSLGSARPLRALWLTNSSSLTLDGGSFSVLEDEAFAGEGLMDPVKPGEKRLVSYAADLGVRVNKMTHGEPQRVTKIRIAHGTMIQTSASRQDTIYTARNDDSSPRTLLIEHPVRPGWRLSADTPKPDETTATDYRFRLSLGAKATATLAVTESSPTESRCALTNLDDNQIQVFVQQKSINPEAEAAFHKIVEQKNKIAALDSQLAEVDTEQQKIFDDQQRIRENLKALKGSSEERALTQRYTQQLEDQESRLQTLQAKTADLQSQRDKAQADLDAMIENLELDATL
ncbi:MAG: carboxypeptidase regulatory-like domain-containing protein [Candidatus Acidiferrales bacterium]